MITVQDCKKFLPTLRTNSIDSCVTDPPYEIGFMNREWDSTEIAYDVEMWADVCRVLKPGGHAIVFSHTTTYDMVATAMRLAGFEIRDMLLWHYGSGFSKGQNISKAIDKKKGAKRRVSTEPVPKRNRRESWTDFRSGRFHRSDGEHEQMQHRQTQPATIEAKMWEGWHTLLKPSTEPAVLAMKPLEQGLTFAENVMKWRTGALNIDACRVPVNPAVDDILKKTRRKKRESKTWEDGSGFTNEQNEQAGVRSNGRFASNLILSHSEDCVLVNPGTEKDPVKELKTRSEKFKDIPILYHFDKRGTVEVSYEVSDAVWACVPSCPIRLMNDQAGFSYASGSVGKAISSRDGSIFKKLPERDHFPTYNQSGYVSRFFYCAKASVKERTMGLPEGMRNEHVSVKPINLLSYYIRLVTPIGGTMLDQFAGVGSSMIAAKLEGMNFVGCEIDPRWVRIAELRFKGWFENNE